MTLKRRKVRNVSVPRVFCISILSSVAAIEGIEDRTETNLVNLRRIIYLTIMNALNYEEAVHKLLKVQLAEGQEIEMVNMIIECCSQERSYSTFYGLVGERFSKLNRVWTDAFEEAFGNYYTTIHRYETNRLRNIARFFGHMLASDAISWTVMGCIRINEDDTTSSSRIFVKIMMSEMMEAMGLKTLAERFKDDEIKRACEAMFPMDIPKNTRFAINYFTSIGLGVVTEDMREYLKVCGLASVARAFSDCFSRTRLESSWSSAGLCWRMNRLHPTLRRIRILIQTRTRAQIRILHPILSRLAGLDAKDVGRPLPRAAAGGTCQTRLLADDATPLDRLQGGGSRLARRRMFQCLPRRRDEVVGLHPVLGHLPAARSVTTRDLRLLLELADPALLIAMVALNAVLSIEVVIHHRRDVTASNSHLRHAAVGISPTLLHCAGTPEKTHALRRRVNASTLVRLRRHQHVMEGIVAPPHLTCAMALREICLLTVGVRLSEGRGMTLGIDILGTITIDDGEMLELMCMTSPIYQQ